MKFKFPVICASLFGAGLMAASAPSLAQPAPAGAASALGPRMAFATNAYDFGKVISGALVKYVFVATNIGDQPLLISKVAPGCHCTTVGDWSKAHQIAPGQTGEIPIQLDTHGLQGTVSRSIKVTSNDKLAPVQNLALRGTVWKAIKVTPEIAYLSINTNATSNSTVVVHITNELDAPLTLSDPISASASFKAELKTVTPGRDFEMTITAIPPFKPGRTPGIITLQTSCTNMPVITVRAYATVQRMVNAASP